MDSPAGYSDTNMEGLGGLGSGIEVLIGFLMLIIIVALTSYCITRMRLSPIPHHHPTSFFTSNTSRDSVVTVAGTEVGLDEATLGGFPKLLYSQTMYCSGKSSTALCCCSVCLADYKESDVLRVLPDCGHVFHLNCADSWLRLHPSCPICRSSPNAMANPLSDDVAVPVPVPLSSLAIV